MRAKLGRIEREGVQEGEEPTNSVNRHILPSDVVFRAREAMEWDLRMSGVRPRSGFRCSSEETPEFVGANPKNADVMQTGRATLAVRCETGFKPIADRHRSHPDRRRCARICSDRLSGLTMSKSLMADSQVSTESDGVRIEGLDDRGRMREEGRREFK